jgi:CRISPR-associated protein Cas1
MLPLYVVEQGATLHKEGERLVVRKEEQVLLSLPVFKVDAVLLFGNVQITTQAVAALLANGVEVSFLSLRGKLKGRLLPAESRNIYLRLLQFQRHHDPAFRLSLSKSLVRSKIHSARSLVNRHLRNHPDADIRTQLSTLENLLARADEAGTLETLRGIEGYASAVYFSAFGRMVRGGLTFAGRTRRPPGDPVNAMLSMGYTLVGQELFGLTAARGFDPYLGFYHDIRYGRPSLALDLLEEFRVPLVDRLILALVNRRVFQPEDFEERDDGGVLLAPDALRRFVAAYEHRVRSAGPDEGAIPWREVFRAQVDLLVKAVRGEQEYTPVRISE